MYPTIPPHENEPSAPPLIGFEFHPPIPPTTASQGAYPPTGVPQHPPTGAPQYPGFNPYQSQQWQAMPQSTNMPPMPQTPYVYPLGFDPGVRTDSRSNSIHGLPTMYNDPPQSEATRRATICSATDGAPARPPPPGAPQRPPRHSQQSSRASSPDGLIDVYTSPGVVHIYFVQKEGHVTAPKLGEMLKAYKNSGSINPDGPDLTLRIEKIWSLPLKKEKSFSCKGSQPGQYAFYDTSTNPARCAVIQMPENISKAEIQRLDVLFTSASNFIEDPSTIIAKIENGVESTFSYITNSANTFVRDHTPDIHKKTHWLRKGASTLVKGGGKLVSQGARLITDPIVDKSPPKDIAPEHAELLRSLQVFRKSQSDMTITYLN